MIVNVRDRILSVGDTCVYCCGVVNGTGVTYANCTITEVINYEYRIYRLTEEHACGQREWIVQDVDYEKEVEVHKGKGYAFPIPCIWIKDTPDN